STPQQLTVRARALCWWLGIQEGSLVGKRRSPNREKNTPRAEACLQKKQAS
ncbi:hypothetical protein ATANTOWER_005285, partial [Ataeniobius toweri]|nr:hypothetical protein [Ataeniobius toweri]